MTRGVEIKNPPVLVISCSDARLSPSIDDPWYRGVVGAAHVYEVRLPGGALGLASPSSDFARAIVESIRMFEEVNIASVILSCHEDCAYYRLNYNPKGGPSESEWAHQKELLASARAAAAEAFPKLTFSGMLLQLKDGSRYISAELGSAPHLYEPMREEKPQFRCETVDGNAPKGRVDLESLRRLSRSMHPSVLERDAYNYLISRQLNSPDDQLAAHGDLMAELRSNAKIESHAREYIELIRTELGIKSTEKLKEMAARFLIGYGRSKINRHKAHSIAAKLSA